MLAYKFASVFIILYSITVNYFKFDWTSAVSLNSACVPHEIHTDKQNEWLFEEQL
jgi:hypothetical protein